MQLPDITKNPLISPNFCRHSCGHHLDVFIAMPTHANRKADRTSQTKRQRLSPVRYGRPVFVHYPDWLEGLRMRYRFEDKEQTLSIGDYPGVSSSEARAIQAATKLNIKAGNNPASEKKALKTPAASRPGADFFHSIAQEWFESRKKIWSENMPPKSLAFLTKKSFHLSAICR
ncbi:DUF4102 domain-containing protein [Sodalis-like symbiont of Bactericera trigonica]|nr:DUF4102 domain-containing protein [Sodalis-like symbiont of Bactericera trigonica]